MDELTVAGQDDLLFRWTGCDHRYQRPSSPSPLPRVLGDRVGSGDKISSL